MRAQDPKPPDQIAFSQEFASGSRDFSVVMGGPIYDFLLRTGLLRRGLPNALHRIIALIIFTWLPLLILSVKDGLAVGHQVKVPFLYDFSMYGRYLLALPLFILAEVVIDPSIQLSVEEFVDSRIVQDKELPRFEEVLHQTRRLRDSVIPELLLLMLAFVPVYLLGREWGMRATVSATSSWHTIAHDITSGGWWFVTVSSPVLRFIIYRWFFRYSIWTLYLWRIMRLQLHLIPTHPDRAAGLGFLSLTQSHFGILFCALGFIFAGHVVNGLVHEGERLASFKFPMAGFLALSIIVGLFPLTLLSPKMAQVRRAGLRKYSKLGNQYTESFEQKWIGTGEPTSEMLLGTSDIQSLADLRNSYQIIEQMAIAPITKRLTLHLAVLAGAPFIPIIIFGTPTAELVREIVKMVT